MQEQTRCVTTKLDVDGHSIEMIRISLRRFDLQGFWLQTEEVNQQVVIKIFFVLIVVPLRDFYSP